MTPVRNVFLIVLALLVQSTVFGRFDIFGARPDFGMLVLIFIAGGVSGEAAVLYGFFIGFMQDVYTPEFLGSNAFTMSLMGFFLGILRETITVEHVAVSISITAVACLVHDIMYLSFYTVFEFPLIFRLFVRESIGGAVYTSVLALVLVSGSRWIAGGGFKSVLRRIDGIGR